jgi:hypothetical protein
MKNSDYEIVQMLRGHAESLMEQATSATWRQRRRSGAGRAMPRGGPPPAGSLYRSAWPDFATFSRAT